MRDFCLRSELVTVSEFPKDALLCPILIPELLSISLPLFAPHHRFTASGAETEYC
jgi:hypothetical protein